MKIISSRLHGILDYLMVVFLLASPILFEMENPLAGFIYGLAAIHFLLTVLTKFELGIIRIIPLAVHGLIEFFVSVALVLVSFWFNKNGNETGYYYCLFLALAIMLLFVLTDYRRKR